MKLTAITLAALAQFWGGLVGNSAEPLPPLLGDQWLAQSVDNPWLTQLAQGETLLFAASEPGQWTDGTPTVTQVYPVSDDILAVEIETGKVIPGQQYTYRSQSSDLVTDEGVLKRNGESLGYIVGRNSDILYTFDRYQGRDIRQRWLDTTRNYRLTSTTDRAFETEQPPQTVFRKSKPIGFAETADGRQPAMRHTVYLKLATPLAIGNSYTLAFEGQALEAQTIVYDPQQIRSEAVHVSQIGFRPNDPTKVGFLSTWMGAGGGLDYSEGMPFWLVDTQTEEIVYEGKTRLSVPADQLEDPYRNYNETNVYALDFHDFQQPGNYQLCVETVGCSFSFPIDNSVWQSTFMTSARGLYHQRSGIAIGGPYTQFSRPRAFHPEDGVRVYQSTAKLMETHMGIGSQNAFEALTEGATETILPNAWGGYFDAGDWDRRIHHLSAAESLLDLAELFPDKMAAIALNIPESNNSLPDILDEALWGIDVFRRLQHDDGGVPGGIESANHPKRGETSWQESLKVMAYAPDIWSSYWYASTAAQAATILKDYDLALAEMYEQSALKAFTYAEKQYPTPPEDGWHELIPNHRNLAALELWRLTQAERFHQIFLETSAFADPDHVMPGRYNQSRAAFIYARLDSSDIDQPIKANARKALLKRAEEIAAFNRQTGFQWGKHHPNAPVGWGISWSNPYEATVLSQAHYLTQNENYLEAILRSVQAPLGANPDNLVYTTGLGVRSPQNPHILDQRRTGAIIPEGITVYGPIDITQEIYQDYWFVRYHLNNVMFPEPAIWPITELYVDAYINVAMTEFTVHQTIGPSAYIYGYLAAQN